MKFVGVNLSLAIVLVTFGSFIDAKLTEKFAWKQMPFDWPSSEVEQEAIKSGRYIPENNLPLGVEKWKNKIFVTVPRWKAGVAASLNYIELPTDELSPKLHPYPSWEANQLPVDVTSSSKNKEMRVAGGRLEAEKAETIEGALKDNSTIISTFRIQIDECDRLWVFDTGLADILGNPKQIAPNAIVIFDLKTDKLIRRFAIPADQVEQSTFFANIIIDSKANECNNAFAYIPDLGAYGVVVYSLMDNRSWRVKHHFFHFDPLKGQFDVGGVKFRWTDGVFGMAVGKPDRAGVRDIYFHALASTNEFKVSNRVLQNETYVTSPEAFFDFKLIGDRGMNGQSTAEVYDKQTDVIFYTQVNKDAIACWNTKLPYTTDNQGLIYSDSNSLVFPNDMKLDSDGIVWVLSDKMPVYLAGKLDPNSVNYRILMGKNTELIKGTPCE